VGTEPVEYCREIEAYLCQKNAGHLMRLVGPSFDLVSGWASKGVPLKIACRGIDRYFDRYARKEKHPRRRPVKIDFCDADVLDAYDEWRRAVGIESVTGPEAPGTQPPAPSTRPSLPAHLERVLLRLTAARVRDTIDATFDEMLDRVSRELDAAKSDPRGLRGPARQALVDRLQALDRELLDAARRSMDEASLARFGRDAEDELSAFRAGMTPDAFARAREAAIDRLVRVQFRLPTVIFR
jgi:hypothetical protein